MPALVISPLQIENDPEVRDGDAGFLRLNARNNPELLAAGDLQVSENLRLDRGVAIVRKGARSRGKNITGSPVLTLPFDLAPDIAVVSITRAGSTATVTTSTVHGLTAGRVVNLRDTGRAAYDADFFALTIPTTTSFTIHVAGAPVNVIGAGIVNAGPVLGTGPIADPVRAAERYVNALSAGKPEYLILAAGPRTYHYQEGSPAVLIVEFPAGETLDESDEVAMIQALDRMYLLRAPQEAGEFAPFTVTEITRVGNLATARASGHWIQVGNRVRIGQAGQQAYNQEFDVTATTPDTFSFTVLHEPTTPATAVGPHITAQRVKPPMYWDGVTSTWQKAPGGSHPAGATYSRMPGNCVIAIYGTNNSLGIARSKDEWWKSGILDLDTYDEFGRSFRTGAGGNDYIVAAQPFADGDELVLCRYSIYRAHLELTADGAGFDPATSYCILLTDEIGCRARDSVATVRTDIYFLADSGVYRIDPNFTKQRLVALSSLLSDPVRPITERIVWDAADAASGVFFNSRYYLLVQRDDQTAPNMLLVYSTLNDAWESVDLFEGLDGVALVTARYNGRERLFCAGGPNVLTLLEDRDDGDEIAGEILPVAGIARTRRYTMGSATDMKRFLRVKAPARLAAGATYACRAILQDPESTNTVGADAALAGQKDVVEKFPIRRSAHSVEIETEIIGPGSELRGVVVEAASPSAPPEQRTRSQS